MIQPTVQLIYPSGQSIACPDAIGRHLASRLSSRWEVDLHPWDEIGCLQPHPNGVLIGHPHPNPLTLFRRSASKPGWRRVIMLNPFNADPRQVSWLAPIIERSDAYIAITGPYWFQVLGSSIFSHWEPRMSRIDLAVDRREFPRVKTRFEKPGKRRFLYIGQSGWPKNTKYLSRLAQALPEMDFAWMGGGTEPVPGVRALGKRDFSDPTSQREVAKYDFMITVGTADANPATVLEAMAWGLVPVCTPESGYVDAKGIINVPLSDPDKTCRILRGLQEVSGVTLQRWVDHNDERLDRYYNWDRFTDEVARVIADQRRPKLSPPRPGVKALMAWYTWTGPHRPWRPSWFIQALRGR